MSKPVYIPCPKVSVADVVPGARFGLLVVVGVGSAHPNKHALVECGCGSARFYVKKLSLAGHHKLDCGCVDDEPPVGKEYARLTCVGLGPRARSAHWACDCGLAVYAMTKLVRTGVIQSCPKCAEDPTEKLLVPLRKFI